MSNSDSDSQSEPEMTYNDLEGMLSDADSETSESWNWRNSENNRLIIQLYKYDKAQDKRLDDIEKKLEELDLRNKPHGGRRTRGKLRAKSRARSRAKSRKKRRKKRRKSKGRKRSRKNLKKRTKRRR